MSPGPSERLDDAAVVVTGMGAASALGTGCAAHLEAVLAGRDGLRPVVRFDTGAFGSAMAGTWPVWDGRRQADSGNPMDPAESAAPFSTVEIALAAGREAWGQAGLGPTDRRRAALVLGTCFGQGFSLFHQVGEAVARGLELQGPALTISTACSSSTNAVGWGRDLLLSTGQVDVVLAGGVDVLLREVLAGFHALGVVSREKCAPFSEPYGIDLGEGAGLIVLERAGQARARGAVALATIDGYGLSADARHETTPDPTGGGLQRAIRWALASAGLTGADINHVNAHATGTESNDRVEWGAIAQALAPRTEPVPVSGLKSFLGHAQGAAGVLELILGILAMNEGLLPPTLRFSRPRPGAPQDPVPGPHARPARVRRAVNLSAAFGGANAALVYGAPDRAGQPDAPGDRAPAAVVVVRGLGLICPTGLGVPPLVAALAQGRCPDGRAPAIDLRALAPTADPRGCDPSAVLLTAAVAQALRESGLAPRGARREQTGLFLAATRMPRESASRCQESLRRHGPLGMSAAAFARMAVNAPAGACAKHLGLLGPSTTVTSGPGSGLLAMAYAADWLARRSDARQLVVAAVDEGPAGGFEGATAALLEQASTSADRDEVSIAGWAIAGGGEVAAAARAALGRYPCPDGIWADGAGGRTALDPLCPDAAALPLGFLDLGARVSPGEACVSALLLLLAVTALRERRARSLLLIAAAGTAASVALLFAKDRTMTMTKTTTGGATRARELEAHCQAREEALASVRRLLIESLDLRRQPDEIDPDTALFGTGLGLDSVDAVEIVITLETDLGVKLGDEKLRRRALRSVNALVDVVLAARKGEP